MSASHQDSGLTEVGREVSSAYKVFSRYPQYQRLVEAFVKDDPARLLRQIIIRLVACGEASHPPVLIVDHELGSGVQGSITRSRVVM